MQDYDPTARDGSLPLRSLVGRRVLAPCRAVWQGSQRSRPFPIGRFSHPARRCRSSVVEHPLGKGEVVSSILTGSTTICLKGRSNLPPNFSNPLVCLSVSAWVSKREAASKCIGVRALSWHRFSHVAVTMHVMGRSAAPKAPTRFPTLRSLVPPRV